MPVQREIYGTIRAELSPELASWLLRLVTRQIREERPHWPPVDPGEVTSLMRLLHTGRAAAEAEVRRLRCRVCGGPVQ